MRDKMVGGRRKPHNEELTKYNKNDQVKEDEISRACSMYGGEEECIQGFGRKVRRKETIMKTLM
jgi:hypothetical protein